MTHLKALRNDRTGSMYVELIVKVFVAVVILLFAVELLAFVVSWQHLNYAAKNVTKVVEQEGYLSSEAYSLLDEYNQAYAMEAELSIDVSPSTKQIQFRDTFHITLTNTYEFTVLSPLFGPDYILPVDMHAKATGVSEVYWK